MNTTTAQLALTGMLSTDFFKALADGSRLKLLLSLASGGREQTVSQIAECCPLSLSVVSRHLKTLKDCGILAAEKRGKEVVYWLRAAEVARQLRSLADVLENCCPDQCKAN